MEIVVIIASAMAASISKAVVRVVQPFLRFHMNRSNERLAMRALDSGYDVATATKKGDELAILIATKDRTQKQIAEELTRLLTIASDEGR